MNQNNEYQLSTILINFCMEEIKKINEKMLENNIEPEPVYINQYRLSIKDYLDTMLNLIKSIENGNTARIRERR